MGAEGKLKTCKLIYADGKREELDLQHEAAKKFAKSAATAFGVGNSQTVSFDPDLAKKDIAGESDVKKTRKKSAKAAVAPSRSRRRNDTYTLHQLSFHSTLPALSWPASGDVPEWPPSPMRAFQALLNAASLMTRGKPLPQELRLALQLLEVLRPSIVAPAATLSSTGYRMYVPHNHGDLVTAAWHRGNYDDSIAKHRVEKDHRPYRIASIEDDFPAVHYLYSLDASKVDAASLLSAVRPTARAVTHLGWGVDQVIADATLIQPSQGVPCGERWNPARYGTKRLRVPQTGRSMNSCVDMNNSYRASSAAAGTPYRRCE